MPKILIEEIKVRKLTPREAFRLMGFEDAEIDRLKAGNFSDHQLYHMAGNSVVVGAYERIIETILEGER